MADAARKKLDLTAPILDFAGEPILLSEGGTEEATLREMLLRYLRVANAFGLTTQEEDYAFELGCKIGSIIDDDEALRNFEIPMKHYNMLTKLVETGKRNQDKSPIFTLEVSRRVREMVENAETVGGDEDKKKFPGLDKLKKKKT